MGTIQSLSSLTSTVPYTVDLQYEVHDTEFWTVKKCSYTNYKNSSYFQYKNYDNNKTEYELALHHIRFLKTLRHPNIVKYLYSHEQPHLNHCIFICESVCPLNKILNEFTYEQVLSGLNGITLAIDFLHNKALISHNNICEENIYVNTKLAWKLNNFELSLQFSEMNHDNLSPLIPYKYEKYRTPEEQSVPNIELLNQLGQQNFKYSHTSDVYSWAKMCLTLLSPFKEQFKVKQQFELFLNKNFMLRPNIQHAFELSLFKLNTNNVDIGKLFGHLSGDNDIEFFNVVQNYLLTDHDQQNASENLIDYLLKPEMFFSKHLRDNLLPFLLIPKNYAKQSSNELLSEPSVILSAILDAKLIPFINDNEYKAYVVPRILNLFSIKILQIRLTLLKYFPYYIHLITNVDVLKYELLPEILFGLKDDNNELVSLTFVCLSVMVKILGTSCVVGTTYDYDRHKIFSDNTPNFNINTINGDLAFRHEELSEIPTQTTNYLLKNQKLHEPKDHKSESIITLNNFDLHNDAEENSEVVEETQEEEDTEEYQAGGDNSWSNNFDAWDAKDVKIIKSDDSINMQPFHSTIQTMSKDLLQQARHKTQSISDHDLGAQYDIKSVNIKVQARQPYDDLFGDMEPVIVPKKVETYEFETDKPKEEEKKEEKVPKQTATMLSFNPIDADTASQEPTSWDDEQLNVDELIEDTEVKS